MKDGEAWVTYEQWTRGGVFKSIKQRQHHKAPFDQVFQCYIKLGVKSNVNSIDFATASLQKELADKGYCMDLTEAMIIARVMRAQQTARLQTALEGSAACQKVKLTK